MAIEDMIDSAKVQELPWDQVRERRVMAAVRGGLRARRQAQRSSRTWVAAGAGAGLAAAVAAFFLVRPSTPETAPLAPQAQVVAPAATTPGTLPGEDDTSVLRLADGSTAAFERGAEVEVVVQDASLTRLRQGEGLVRYEVSRNASRDFVVAAGDVQVRVIGTAFEVAHEAGRVRVAVERGEVEVDDGSRAVSLFAGDVLEVPAFLGDTQTGGTSDLSDDAEPAVEPVRTARAADTPSRPTVRELMRRADEARAAGDLGRASDLLREIVAAKPGRDRSTTALFTLGRVERSRGRHAEAARAFQRCWKRAPQGPLAEDSRAEEAASWSKAGSKERAAKAARRYVELYPAGTHTARMQSMLAVSP